MDLIIKNLERLKDYSNGNHKPIERVVVDFDKLATEDFTQIFFDACEEHKVAMADNWWRTMIGCDNCKYRDQDLNGEPCVSCWKSHNRPNWKPAEPTFKEATEHMQSEFDATGIDTKIFMNGRIIKR